MVRLLLAGGRRGRSAGWKARGGATMDEAGWTAAARVAVHRWPAAAPCCTCWPTALPETAGFERVRGSGDAVLGRLRAQATARAA
ncbi:hypothetical protein [Rhodanobacter lindaniclasticus]